MISAPHGLVAIKKTFGDPTPYINKDRTVSPIWETLILTRITLPAPLVYGGNLSQKVTRVACHKLIADPLLRVFTDLYSGGYWSLIKTYEGAYNFRPVASTGALSTHAWAISIDLNAEWNRQGKKPMMPRPIIDAFEAQGFFWGGHWPGKRVDGMHFQYCTGY